MLEVGPGKGALTRELLARARRVVAIERDSELAARVADEVAGRRSQVSGDELRGVVGSAEEVRPATFDMRLSVHHADALSLDWHALAGPDFLVAGNIPYHITSPLIDKALTPPRPRRIVFLVQKEVAERVVARPGSKEYGALTVGVQAVARAEKLFTVSRGAFHPVPKVDSAVLRLTPLEEPLVTDDEVAGFRRFVVGIFAYRRKQLVRALRELTGWSAEEAGACLARCWPAGGPAASARPGDLSPAEFVALFRGCGREGGRAVRR